MSSLELFQRVLNTTLDGRDLDPEVVEDLLGRVLAGDVDSHWLAGWLAALRSKGETTGEIVGMARAMRAHATAVPTRDGGLLDTCGTGGDGRHTFNVSTASAFVAAGAGARVAKHGNRSVSSRCGSADVLEALGGRLVGSPALVGRCVDEVGFGFLFAPALHGAMRHAMPARRALGVRTVFNLLGPLTNPAGARHQVIGVFAREWVGRIAEVLRELDAGRSLVVHGRDGLDEISVSAVTDAVLVDGDRLVELEIDPRKVGIGFHDSESLRGGDAEENARIIRSVLDGKERGAARDVVRINAGAALWVSGRASDLAEGVDLGTRAIDDGQASGILDRWSALTRDLDREDAA